MTAWAKNELPEVFWRACAEYDPRYARTEPFVYGERWCATDGRIAVRGPAGSAEGQPDTEDMPPINELPWYGEYRTEPLVLPALGDLTEPHPPQTCPDCEGTGLDDDAPNGNPKCETCRGAGKVEPKTRIINIGPVTILKRYLRIMVETGATARLHSRHSPDPTTPLRPMRLEWSDGVEGLLMPCWQNTEPDIDLSHLNPISEETIT